MEQKNLKVFPTFDDILGKTFDIFVKFYTKGWFKPWLLITGIYFVVVAIYNLRINKVFDTYLLDLNFYGPTNFWDYFTAYDIVLFIVTLFFSIFVVVYTVGYIIELINRINEYGTENLPLEGISKNALKKFGRILGFIVLFDIVLLLIAIPSILLLEIPLLILAVYWRLGPYAYIVEKDLGFVEALSFSLFLVKRNWWKTFGLFFVSSLLVGFISGFFNLFLSLFSKELASLISIFISFLFIPFGSILSMVIYLAYKKQKLEAETEIQTQ